MIPGSANVCLSGAPARKQTDGFRPRTGPCAAGRKVSYGSTWTHSLVHCIVACTACHSRRSACGLRAVAGASYDARMFGVHSKIASDRKCVPRSCPGGDSTFIGLGSPEVVAAFASHTSFPQPLLSDTATSVCAYPWRSRHGRPITAAARNVRSVP
jgi:hypothetical protein